MIRSTYAIPAIVAAVSLLGLILALTGDGLRDALSWAALATPIAAVAWAMRGRRRPTTKFRKPSGIAPAERSRTTT